MLVSGADPNHQDTETGITPLHAAVYVNNVAIVKLLLAFEAVIDINDNEGRTPLVIAKSNNSVECVAVMETIALLRDRRTELRKMKMEEIVIPEKSRVRLVSLDGGGTRGSVCVYTLHYIEKRMKEIAAEKRRESESRESGSESRESESRESESISSELHIRHYFDWFAGTSIGSMFSMMMSHNSGDTYQLMSAVVNNRIESFSSGRIYDEVTQEQILKRLIGEKELRSVADPKVLVTTTQADVLPPQLICITNYRENPGNDRNWKAWEAARASSSAPLFFTSFEGRYVDGGILAVNPTQHALHDIHVYDNSNIGLVLSLGTGVFKPSINEYTLDAVKPRLSHLVSDIQKDVKFLKSLLKMLTANIINPQDSVIHSKAWCESLGGVFHRLSPPLSVRHELDEKSDEAFVMFFYETYLYLLQSEEEISVIAHQLLEYGVRWSEHSQTKLEQKKFKSTWV